METLKESIVITVKTKVSAPIELVWSVYTDPKHIVKWNTASTEWHTPKAVNNLVEGGSFCYRMESKDGKIGFDLEGKYSTIEKAEELQYTLSDGRQVKVTFSPTTESRILVVQTFEAENENPMELQAQGWQAILDNFKTYCEGQL
ncbi:MAG: SRPBCC domain-containing protein [Bacteroidetes bacterium]|nr:SRPBCC domain-containing protein [Bacteroidota bacterium]